MCDRTTSEVNLDPAAVTSPEAGEVGGGRRGEAVGAADVEKVKG